MLSERITAARGRKYWGVNELAEAAGQLLQDSGPLQAKGTVTAVPDERTVRFYLSEGLLDSALARPLNVALYPDPDVAGLAASYGIGIAKNHAFVDGNKRAAFLPVGLFLVINGYRLVTTQADATLTMLAVAAGDMDEGALADWIRAHIQPR